MKKAKKSPAKVTLTNKRDAKKFKVGEWVLMAAIDIIGRPVNLKKIGYLTIKSIDQKTGVVTLGPSTK